MTTELKLSISKFLTRSSYALLFVIIAVNLWMKSAPLLYIVAYLLPLAIFLPGMITDTIATAKPIQSDADRTHVVIMSNGGFAGIHSQLLDQLKLTYP